MKIEVHLLASDDDSGTNAQAFATASDAEEALLEAVGQTFGDYHHWQNRQAEKTRDDGVLRDDGIFDFVSLHKSDPHLDTYNIDSHPVEIALASLPLPATNEARHAEAMECLARAQQLLSAPPVPAPAAKPARVLITLEGGLVQGGCSDVPVSVIVVDYDVEGTEEGDTMPVPQDEGDPVDACVSGQDFKVDPTFIDRVVEVIVTHV